MANEKRLIDANVVLAKQFTTGLSDASGNYYGHADVVFVDDIENAPTVDAVEVVHGRWIDRPTMKGQVYCSECATLEKETDSNYRSRRCPHCGAKMDGDGNG